MTWIVMTYAPPKATGTLGSGTDSLPAYTMLALTLIGIAAALRLAFDPFSTSLRFRAVLYAGVGAVSSLYFMYLQLGFIQAVCIYCLISAVTTFLLLFAAIWHFLVTRNPIGKG